MFDHIILLSDLPMDDSWGDGAVVATTLQNSGSQSIWHLCFIFAPVHKQRVPCLGAFHNPLNKATFYLTTSRFFKEMFYLTTNSTHFIYGYMASEIW